jgi:hypothetical protein
MRCGSRRSADPVRDGGRRRLALTLAWALPLLALVPSGGRARAEPYSGTRAEDLRPRLLLAEERVLALAPESLQRFEPETEAWTQATPRDGLPGPPLRFVGVTGADIWVTGDGVAVSSTRFDDWRRYAPGEGIPGRAIAAVAADEDYAYAATDSGAARFDRFVLEWEPLAIEARLGPATDVAIDDDRVWFGLSRGVAEYRKDTESVRVDSLLGALDAPRVLLFARSPRWLWAVTDAGIARYDPALRSWTSFRPGADFPDARVRGVRLAGDDLWLGTDDGLWRFRADTGLWRRDESDDTMPGRQVRAFAVDSDLIWVATERALAVYQPSAARWIEFTESSPIAPAEVGEILDAAGVLFLLGRGAIAYGIRAGETNPTRFTWRTRAIGSSPSGSEPAGARGGTRVALRDAGLTLERGSQSYLAIKGGTTLFLESLAPSAGNGLGTLQSEFRTDVTAHGRFAGERTLNGFYDTTDPENAAYQLTWRGAREDLLREASLGEIVSDPYNARLTPGTGLRGGRVRLEAGPRGPAARRRLLTADAWGGSRLTRPGHDVFVGGNRRVEGRLRDRDYAVRTVFRLPAAWAVGGVRLYRDDALALTDDANTEHRSIAGIAGAWDRLRPETAYIAGPEPETLILVAPLHEGERLVAVAGAGEADLTSSWLKNHYPIGIDPLPGSLDIAIVDSTGAGAGPDGEPYLRRFGLDRDADGLLDAERFRPSTGYLAFPEPLPFPETVYADSGRSIFELRYAYEARRPTFRLGREHVVPGSERITVDRALLRANVDYTIIPSSGLFSFFEHVVLDDDSVIEIRYLFEESGGDPVLSGQLGVAPADPLFFGANATRWEDARAGAATTGDLNARLEWKGERHLLRASPEWALSGSERGGAGWGAGGSLQARYGSLEVTAAHRAFDAAFVSLEDRGTRLGRLREETEAGGRLGIGAHLQTELEWDRAESAPESTAAGAPLGGGVESSLFGTVRLLRSGLPNLEVRRGLVTADSAGAESERRVTRADLEISPEQAGVRPLGPGRLWLRAFAQRSDRRGDGTDRRITDTGFARLNGSVGDPLSWNLAFEDRLTHRPDPADWECLERRQRLDLSLQVRPHASLDAYGRLESDRELHYLRRRAPGGFATDRLGLTTIHLIPGRLYGPLAPLSLRVDWLVRGNEDGDPGAPLPGAAALWGAPSTASLRQSGRDGVVEARLQARSWLRIVEGWEEKLSEVERAGTGREARDRRWETRLEMQPAGGLLILRGLAGQARVPEGPETRTRQFVGQWDQTWGGGLLTNLALDALRADSRDRLLDSAQEIWNPQGRLTWRRSRWQTDASLGWGLTWDRRRDPATGSRQERQRSLDVSLSLKPHRVLTFLAQYAVRHAGGGGPERTTQDLRLRLQVRAG